MGLVPLPRHSFGLRHVHDGLKFKPWTDEDSIAAGEKIRTYITDVASEYDITERIMFGHRAIHADWSSEDRTWTVSIRNNAGDVLTITTRFLLNCSGYYNYEQGFSPTLRVPTNSPERSCTRSIGPKTWSTPGSAWS